MKANSNLISKKCFPLNFICLLENKFLQTFKQNSLSTNGVIDRTDGFMMKQLQLQQFQLLLAVERETEILV